MRKRFGTLEAVGAALNHNKRLIVFSTLGPAVAALAFCALVNPRYNSESRILVETQANAPQSLDAATVNRQMQLLTSRDLARKVVQTLELQNNPEFDRRPGLLAPLVWLGVLPDPSRHMAEDRALTSFFDHLTVTSPAGTRVLKVAFSSRDPDLSARAANTVADLYADLQIQIRRERAPQAAQNLKPPIAALEARVAEAEARVDSFRAEKGEAPSVSSRQPDEIAASLAEARAAQSTAEARASGLHELLRQGRLADAGDISLDEQAPLLSEQRRQGAVASADATPPDARIISRALSPSQPVFPNTIPITLFAALAGLVFSAGAIAMRAMSSRRAPSRRAPPPPREMADLALPDPPAHDAPPAQPPEPQATPLPARVAASRRLIERIAEASGRGGAHVLIASADDSTPVCASLMLARSLALEGRAILLQTDDEDLFLREALEVAAGGACDASHPGLTQLLSGEASFADAIFRDDASRLHIVQAGGPVDAHSSDLSLILDALYATYDFVLIAAGADAAAHTLAADSDLTLIFANDRQTRAVLHGDFEASGARPIVLAGLDRGGEIVEIAA